MALSIAPYSQSLAHGQNVADSAFNRDKKKYENGQGRHGGHLQHELVLGDALDRLQQVGVQRQLVVQLLLALLLATEDTEHNIGIVFTSCFHYFQVFWKDWNKNCPQKVILQLKRGSIQSKWQTSFQEAVKS